MTADDELARTTTITLVPVSDDTHSVEEQFVEQHEDFQALNFNEVQHRAIASIMRTALLDMAENPEDWMPKGAIKSRDRIGMFVLWNIGYIDDEVLQLQAQAESEERTRLANLRRLAESSEPA
jgi:hypothetical protein